MPNHRRERNFIFISYGPISYHSRNLSTIWNSSLRRESLAVISIRVQRCCNISQVSSFYRKQKGRNTHFLNIKVHFCKNLLYPIFLEFHYLLVRLALDAVQFGRLVLTFRRTPLPPSRKVTMRAEDSPNC
jgi:hypothetical protein